jgi:D-sedoheptulose 7-phosphate isomerase
MNTVSYQYIESLKGVLDKFPHFDFERLIKILLKAYHEERRIFVMGNGGSAATASHWVCDINKGCCQDIEKKFKMICLNDSISTMLAYANDLSYADIFVEQLKNLFVPGDVVIGISVSGTSINVIKAINYARVNNGITIGLCGFPGGQLRQSVHIPLVVAVADMQQVEDIHVILTHMAMQNLAKEINDLSLRHKIGGYPLLEEALLKTDSK